MPTLNLPTEFKALGDSGEFEGYASIFGNVDLGGDIIERGAFKEFVKNAAGKIKVLWQHRHDSPIGVAEVKEDDRGLWFRGSLVLEDPTARKVHAHMKAGSADAMSIGYDVLPGGAELMKSGVRQLKALKLWEISVVTFGMNPLAGVTTVKTIRDFEAGLRDVFGFSQREARAIAASGYKAADDARDVPDVAAVKAAIDSFSLSFRR